MEPHTTNSLDALLSNLGRVQAVARSLVRDAASADDLVQDAVVTALKRRREITGSAAAWNRTTLRNLSRNEARGKASRSAREREVARPEALPAASEGAARAEVSRDVSSAVLALDEPYRTVILLRFFEELPPREIAARTGASVEAVKKQLARGQRELQRKLEARYGDRGAWAVALLPLTGPKVLGMAKALGASGVALRAALVVLALGASAFSLAWLLNDTSPTPPPAELSVELASLPEVEAEALAPGAEPTRVAAPVPAPLATAVARGSAEKEPEPKAAMSPGRTYRGRVVDLNGDPIQGFKIKWVDKGKRNIRVDGTMTMYESLPSWRWRRASIETDRNGAFSIPRYPSADERNETWSCPDESLAILTISRDADDVNIYVVSPAVRVAGIVRDAQMQPLKGVKVTKRAGLYDLPTFKLPIENGDHGMFSMRTNEAGEFDFGICASHPAMRLSATMESSGKSVMVSVPESGDDSISIVLPDAEQSPKWVVFGTLKEADGTPLPSEIVYLGAYSAKTDEQGRFRISSLRRFPTAGLLLAQLRDYRFFMHEPPTEAEAFAPGGAGPIEMSVPARRLRLRGQVVDADGQPLEGIEVYAMNGTFKPNTYVRYEHDRKNARPEVPIVSDSKGIFTIPQVMNRPYHVRFIDPSTMQVHDVFDVDPTAGPIRATLPSDEDLMELTGQIVDVFNQPIAGARMDFTAAITASPGAMKARQVKIMGTTDEHGLFAFQNVHWKSLNISVVPPGLPTMQSKSFELTESLVSRPLKLQLELQCDVEIDNKTVPDVDVLHFVTDDGEQLGTMEHRPGLRNGSNKLEVSPNGSFYPASVSQRATQIVLYQEGEEVGRTSIRLKGGVPNKIEL